MDSAGHTLGGGGSLSADEIRERRLATLGGGGTGSVGSAKVIGGGAGSRGSAKMAGNTNMAGNLKRKTEVIDLLWDDSDDDEAPSISRQAASKSSSSSHRDNERKPAAKKVKKAPQDENNKQNANARLAVTIKKASSSSSQSTSKAASLKTTTSSSGSGLTFNVATYNIWFGPGDGPLHPDERMFALTQALLAKNAPETPLYFLGLQEVTPELYSTLKPVLESAGYKMVCQDLSGGGYGCALAVLQTSGLDILQCGWQPYRNTIMGRGFLYVRARLPNSTKSSVLFTTTHLESFVRDMGGGKPYTGAPEREQQVKELETFCQTYAKRYPDLSLAMISGDLNWDDERVQSTGNDKVLTDVLASKEWKDSWFPIRDRRRQAVADRNGKVKKKDEPQCYTYDAKENPMLGGNLRRRFDRILFRQQNGLQMNVDDIEMVGKEAIDGLTYKKVSRWNGRVTSTKELPVLPSDHYGYVVTLNGTDFN